ncbi:hypothetical protein GF351_03305 [Candidatus Woesearchaeota archaeon]|nr:hypothetical protein [Candidatus Woesearchaeota archaeon]
MIRHIKGLIQVKQLCDDISEKTRQNSESVAALQEQISELSQQNKDLKKLLSQTADIQKAYASNMKGTCDALMETGKEFEKELTDLKMLKSRLKDRLVDELSADFRKSLAEEAERLRTDVRRYNELKQRISALTASFDSLDSEIKKFLAISAKIREGDFELQKHAKKLQEQDKEKLQLMRKIDALERLISKERRSRRN